MSQRVKVGVTILLLLAVAYIFVMPALDLDPTALRGMRLAILVFASIAAAASILDVAKPVCDSLAFAPLNCDLPTSDLTDLTCARLF